VDSPIAVDDLRDAEVDTNGHKRNGLVFAQLIGMHQEIPHLAESIAHRVIDGRLFEDLALCVWSKVSQVLGIAEPVDHPLLLGLEQGPAKARQGSAFGNFLLLVEDELKETGPRGLDRRAGYLAVPHRRV